MKNPQNATIGLLLVTAAILGALLIGSYTHEASAVGTSMQSGRYILATGQVTDSQDYLYVIDLGQGQLNMYFYDIRSKRLTIGQPVDLKKLFAAAP